ncbi:MAG TPA: hypothetical protein VMR25_18440 [Planctomycetaceae bacterium]|nr:hypothetical protein [Planctomycetaceae bacterium]
MHDGETTRSSSARRLVGGLRQTLSPRALTGLCGKLVIGCGAFINSRRWLIGSLLITGVLLALVLHARPTPHVASNVPGEPDIIFDEVKKLPSGSNTADSRFRPGTGVEGRFPGDELKSEGRFTGLSPNGTDSEEGGKPREPLALTRRLDAVRSRRARGAWLTGTIDSVAETASPDAAPKRPLPQLNLPQQSALQTPEPILR